MSTQLWNYQLRGLIWDRLAHSTRFMTLCLKANSVIFTIVSTNWSAFETSEFEINNVYVYRNLDTSLYSSRTMLPQCIFNALGSKNDGVVSTLECMNIQNRLKYFRRRFFVFSSNLYMDCLEIMFTSNCGNCIFVVYFSCFIERDMSIVKITYRSEWCDVVTG